MMRKKAILILMCIVLCTWLSSLLALSMPNKYNDKIEEKITLIDSIVKPSSVRTMDSIKDKLIKEVEDYIFGNFPKTHKTIPRSIVENGLEKDVDIMFMMAQTQIETHFGTVGAGRETSRRSLFGVAKRRYSNYDEAIMDYIAILKKSYLTRGRTEHHLMRNYTTYSGNRYASNPNYEVELRGTYSDINKRTKIKLLQDRYKKNKKEN